ncbi:hypothetical protein JCM6882_006548 [Rhodosporidiobolus microsporus]
MPDATSGAPAPSSAAALPSRPSPLPATSFADPDWVALLACYQDGTSGLNSVEQPVPQPASLRFEGESPVEGDGPAEDAPTASAEEVREEGTAAWAQETYRRKGYLPAMKSPFEDQRQQTLRRYSLSPPTKIKAVDDLCALGRDVFDMPIVLINLVLEDRIVFLSSSGWSEKERDPDWPPETYELSTAMCSHAMSKGEDDGCFVIPDFQQDWRFVRGPYCQEGKGPVQFFASANVNLPAHVAPGEAPRSLPVGSFCLVDSKPRVLSEKQQDMLKKFAKMAAKEVELVFQRDRNALIEARHTFVANLFRSLLVYPSRVTSTTFEERCNLDGIAQNLVTHARSDVAFILDLRNFNYDDHVVTPADSPRAPLDDPLSSPPSTASRPRPPLHRRATQSSQTSQTSSAHPASKRAFSSRRDPAVHGPGSISILDCSCREAVASGADLSQKKKEWISVLNSAAGFEAVSSALQGYHTTRRTSWASSAAEASPFAPLLDGIQAYVATPIFDNDGEPALYVIIGSKERHFAYEDSDERFINGIGGLLMAAMLQERIVAADQAKLAFVGSVSHELRTPIFAIAGNLDLVRQLTDPSALEKIAPLLDVAETCLGTLKDVLDDCLEYSKLSNSSTQRIESPSEVGPPVKLTRCNILTLVTDVIKTCWSKGKRLAEMMDRQDGEGVSILLESHLPPDLEAMCDVGGLKRIGINLLGNALKFTSEGAITIRLSEAPAPPSSSTPSLRYIRFQSIDSGKGMTQEFLRDSLFTPFKQADPFAAGAGLGVSLAAQLVARMGGQISFSSDVGIGTTATVVVPIEVVPSSSPSSVPLPILRNFSDELSSLAAGGGSRGPSRTPSPHRGPHAPATPLPLVSPPMSSPHTEDLRRTENLATGAVEELGRATADVRTDLRAIPELDGPLENRAGDDQVKVLVVDDNTVARRVLCAFLRSKNITFSEASGGAQAIELFRSRRPNLVWCDIQMPEVDGIEATREMRRIEEQEDRPPARIVAISGLDADHGEHSGLIESRQFDRWIVKGGSSLRTLTADMLEYTKGFARSSPPTSTAAPPARPSSAPLSSPPTSTNGISDVQEGVERLKVQA